MMAFTTKPRGAAAVEFALVLPLLLMIVFGTIEWGYYFFSREIVINSAREGARAGTLQYASGTSATTVAVSTTTSYLTSAGLGPPKAQIIAPSSTCPSGSSCIQVSTAPASGTCPSGSSCIRVQYTFPSLTGFLDAILGPTRTIDAYAEMRKS